MTIKGTSNPYYAILLASILFLSSAISGQTNETRVLVLGNTADIPAQSSFFPAFRQFLEDSERPIHLVLTGDFIKDCTSGEPHVENLEDLFKAVEGIKHLEVTALPGDRDWSRSEPDGYICARALEKIIEQEGPDNMHWPIDDACPGPSIKKIAPDIVLISINTQWWNHPHRKPMPSDASCDYITPGVILEEIQDAIEENLDKYILIAGHFPPASLGQYGGRFPITKHLLPPLIGSLQVAYRQNIGTSMDLGNEHFEFFSQRLKALALEYEGLAFISGHEHNQQMLSYRGNYLINSGAPVKGEYSLPTKRAIVSSKKAGFLELAYGKDEEVAYVFHHWTGEKFIREQEGPLFQSPCQIALDTSLMVSPTTHCLEEDSVNLGSYVQPSGLDSTVAVAGVQYKAGKWKQFFFGSHYRTSWTTPIKVPYLQLDTVKGGLRPVKRGGGRQTISLKMQAKNGKEYVFRSVDKDPAKAFSILLRNTIITDVTRDQTSTQHPYGALVVAPLLDEIDILHANPHLYVMPPDPRLSLFQSTFSGMLGMLEERPSDPKPGQKTFGGADAIYKSHEFFRDLMDDPNVKLDTRSFARARLFDILIGDWSKHEDNWKWAGYRENDQIIVRPIPRDRDHAFSNLDGLFPWVADRQWAVPNLENFGEQIKSIRSLTFQARHMDRFLAHSLSREDWLAEAKIIQQQISNEDIEKALSALPPPIYPLSGLTIEAKLKQRKKNLQAYAQTFYELLAKKVDVVGTNEDEHFMVKRLKDGKTTVERRLVDGGSLLYKRTFLPEETDEINLFGLHGNDVFEITGQAEKAILVRVIGGQDRDKVQDLSQIKKGGKRTFIYEKSPRAEIETGEEARRIEHWREELYQYDRTAFEYNSYLPIASLGFNSFNGISLSGGLNLTRRNFQKRDFSSKHKINASISTLGNYTFNYEGHWHEVLHQWDLRASTGYGRPITYNFFFGVGSQTPKDEELFEEDYYRFFINALHADFGVYRPFLRRSHFAFTFGYEHNKPEQTEETILADLPDLTGNKELNIINVKVEAELDFRDHENFPTRGIRVATQHESGFVSGKFYRVTDLLTEFFITPHRLPFTAAFQGGYSTTAGDVPFYKLPSLGMQGGLRGYQRNRFTGDRRLYWNAELRIPLGSFQTPVIPLRLGLRGFYDRGQISSRDETKGPWRSAYGVGLYLIPITRSYAISVFASFSEEESGLLGFQLGTNF